MSNIPSIEALEAVHQFPDWYTMKVFGPADNDFASSCVAEIATFMGGDDERYKTSTRQSKEGNHVCVTILAYYQNAEDVQTVYQQLLDIDSVRMIL